jgi:hypothetical protein
MNDRSDFEKFLNSTKENLKISHDFSEVIMLWWNVINEATKLNHKQISLPVFSNHQLESSEKEDRHVSFVWSKDRYILEIDIAEDGKLGWFFKDRHMNTYEFQEKELMINEQLPVSLTKHLKHFMEIN